MTKFLYMVSCLEHLEGTMSSFLHQHDYDVPHAMYINSHSLLRFACIHESPSLGETSFESLHAHAPPYIITIISHFFDYTTILSLQQFISKF